MTLSPVSWERASDAGRLVPSLGSFRLGRTLTKSKTDSISVKPEVALRGPGRRAKIICTIGPSCNTEPILRDLMRLGMDVARLNFSHGSHADHARSIKRLRQAAEKEQRTICILQDLQGPKIRTGSLDGHA